jgi:hypothetical protein
MCHVCKNDECLWGEYCRTDLEEPAMRSIEEWTGDNHEALIAQLLDVGASKTPTEYAAAREIYQLRDKLEEAGRTFRALATNPLELNAGYDHYATCRDTARMAADSIDRALNKSI